MFHGTEGALYISATENINYKQITNSAKLRMKLWTVSLGSQLPLVHLSVFQKRISQPNPYVSASVTESWYLYYYSILIKLLITVS
jgi:hypothetical protein